MNSLLEECAVTPETLCSQLKLCQDITDNVNALFRCGRLKIWNAIVNHIETASMNKCYLVRKDRKLKYWRGSGPVSFKRAIAYPIGAHPYHKSTLRVMYTVSFEEGEDGERGYAVEEMIDIPTDLVTNYSDVGFKAWLEKQKVLMQKSYESDLRKAEAEYKRLKALVGRARPSQQNQAS